MIAAAFVVGVVIGAIALFIWLVNEMSKGLYQ